MNHVAVDLGAKQSQVCIRLPTGEQHSETRLPTAALREFFATVPPSRVVLEACSEAFAVANWAKAKGHEVTVVPSTMSKLLGVGARGVKTDRRDAQNLSLASCQMSVLPSVHIPSASSRELKALLAARADLVQARTMHTNCLRGYLRQSVLAVKKGGSLSTLFIQRVREALQARPEGLPRFIERTLKVLECLNQQLKEANLELKELVQTDKVCALLMTAPGVGPVTAATFRATIDDPKRFPDAQRLASYLGMTPSQDSSGARLRMGHVTKAGSTMTRTALVQAAWSAWKCRPDDPMVLWAKQLATRRPKQVAVMALARKLSAILFAMWKSESPYKFPKNASAVN
jgi:transposase